ncbi:unnamed protein product [Allacma fusca]|uniref:Uncharacterized protein n=1 Tax=Allacma fusca TaxID=39272 RepID=A0A8J2MGI6_9HEXA|nr:unnamed protein product [Allacma fusca]
MKYLYQQRNIGFAFAFFLLFHIVACDSIGSEPRNVLGNTFSWSRNSNILQIFSTKQRQQCIQNGSPCNAKQKCCEACYAYNNQCGPWLV